MTTVFAVALAAGFIALLGWIALASAADSVDGWSDRHPDKRFGRFGRPVVAGVVAFGMAGISATFAGWSAGFAFVGAVVGGILIALVADRLGDRPT